MFSFVMDDCPEGAIYRNVNRRVAVRAVLRSGERLLLVANKRGDWKFPGGGVALGETHLAALEREVAEETGYRFDGARAERLELLGTAVQRTQDSLAPGDQFEMTSHYYLVEAVCQPGRQALDDYESDLGFAPVWGTVDEALARNRALLDRECSEAVLLPSVSLPGADRSGEGIDLAAMMNGWLRRDTMVLEWLKENLSR